MKNILIVDDEERIRTVIKTYAENDGYTVFEASDGYEALEIVKQEELLIVILDIMMPKLDGFTTLTKIKEISEVPIIMLSARQEEHDKLHSFGLGVDDYVTKPFSAKELMARVKAVSYRKNNTTNQVYRFEGLEIDVDSHVVTIDGEVAHLTPKEFELLHYLVTNQNKVITREQFLSELWNYDYFGDDRTIDTHIKMLRANLKQYRKFIVTVRGLGYRFES